MKRSIHLLAFLLVFISCEKETDPRCPDPGTFIIEVNYSLDGQDFEMNKLDYELSDGTPISVTRLEWYMSRIELYKIGLPYVVDFWFYQNMETIRTSFLVGIMSGDYDSMFVHIGLPPETNVSYGLGNDAWNIGMNWPDNMGGGYHFMKLEGHAIGPMDNLDMRFILETISPMCVAN